MKLSTTDTKIKGKRSESNGNHRTSAKKQRHSNSTEELKTNVTKLEDLPGELWWKIFSYIDGENIFNSFSKLNYHIENLLMDSRFFIHFNFNTSNRSILSYFHSNQIRSLSIDYTKPIIDESINVNIFTRLRRLSLINIKDSQLETLSKSSLINIYQLLIQSKSAKYLSKILLLYFPHVPKIKLNTDGNEFIVKLSDRQINGSSKVQHLVLEGKMKLSKLFRLWPMIPDLDSFSLIHGGVHQCDYWIDEDLINQTQFPNKLSCIYLTIFDDDLSFSNLERLIPKTLKSLHISGSMADDDLDDYLSSQNWKRLMLRSSFKYLSIQLDLSSYFDPSDPTGLQKTLSKFRNDAFFRQVNIRSKQFFITIKGLIEIDDENQ